MLKQKEGVRLGAFDGSGGAGAVGSCDMAGVEGAGAGEDADRDQKSHASLVLESQ